VGASPLRRWPAAGVSHVPYWADTDPEIYARGQARIFCGRDRRGVAGDWLRRQALRCSVDSLLFPNSLIYPAMSEQWTEVARLDEVPESGTFRTFLGAEPVCLYNLGGTIYATHDTCTHAQASLADGFVDGENIECPLHQALFHIPTGKVLRAPATVDVRIYQVKVENGAVFLQPAGD